MLQLKCNNHYYQQQLALITSFDIPTITTQYIELNFGWQHDFDKGKPFVSFQKYEIHNCFFMYMYFNAGVFCDAEYDAEYDIENNEFTETTIANSKKRMT